MSCPNAPEEKRGQHSWMYYDADPCEWCGLPIPKDLSNGCTNIVSKFAICGELWGDERIYCDECTERIKNEKMGS